MRIGILSDIHANYEALSAAWRPSNTRRSATTTAWVTPSATADRPTNAAIVVRDLVVSTILGNHDAAVAGRMDYSYYYEAARHALDTHAQMLSTENMQWLRSLPYQVKLDSIAVNCATARRCGSRSSNTSSRRNRRANAADLRSSSVTSR
jgi:hypothetical protein